MGHAGDRTFQCSMVSAAVRKLRASDVPLGKKGEFPETKKKKKKQAGPSEGESEVMREGWKIPKARGNSVHKSLERLRIVDNFSIAGAMLKFLPVKELEFILRATWKH